MLKNTLLTIAAGSALALSTAVGFASGNYERDKSREKAQHYEMINGLKYHKMMQRAVSPTKLMHIAFGTKPENVGGFEQDEERATEGFPPAFREGNAKDEIWVLDSINGALKMFKAAKLAKNINIKHMGNAADFAISKNGNIAILNSITGNIFIIDPDGKPINNMDGYNYATSIEFCSDKALLVVHPMAKGVAKVDMNGNMLELYVADQSLSNYSNERGLWGIECMGKSNAKLFVRSDVDPAAYKVLTQFPFEVGNGVEYKGGNIYGFDAKGNVYFGLIACDPNGVIYRERLYKCDSNGKLLKQKDILSIPGAIAPRAPRHRIVCKDGSIMTFTADENGYYLYAWDMNS